MGVCSQILTGVGGYRYGTRAAVPLSLTRLMVAACLLLGEALGQGQYFITEPRNTYVLDGQSVNLYCRVGNKVGLAFWQKDSHVLAKENGPRSGFNAAGGASWAVFGNASLGEFHLQLVGVGPADRGRYACKVTARRQPPADNLTSADALLRVQPLPAGDYPVCVMSVREGLTEGDVVEITCAYLNNSTDGGGDVTLAWQRLDRPALLSNARQTADGDHHLLKRHTLTLTHEDDDATYQCVVSARGRPPRSCTTHVLDVRFRPVAELSPLRLLARPASDARFTCRLLAANPPDVTFRWEYRGSPVTASSSSSQKVDLVRTGDGTSSEILVRNMDDPTGGASVACEVTNGEGTSRLEALVELEEIEDVLVTSEELVLWLIACSIFAALILLSLFLGIAAMDCCPCCRGPWKGRRSGRDRSPDTTWSAADNFALEEPSPPPMVRRLSEADSTDFYLTRAIKSPRQGNGVAVHLDTSGGSRGGRPAGTGPLPYNARSRTPPGYRSRTPPGFPSRSPSPEARPPATIFYHSTPRPTATTAAAAAAADTVGNSHYYEQNRSRNDRGRDHYRVRGGGAAAAGVKHATNAAGRSSALSDSGLDFNASSSVDSRSPTPRDERVVYAKIVRSGRGAEGGSGERADGAVRHARTSPSARAESGGGAANLGPGSAGARLPTSSTSPGPPRSTLEIPAESLHRARSLALP